MHLALFYDGDQDYLDGVFRFVDPALKAGEPVAMAVPPTRAPLLRSRLGEAADGIRILDMHELGRNPSRIIPEIEGMLADCEGARLHYVGEPVWPGRSREEIQEVAKHEALINLAWPGVPITVLCPYDTKALGEEVLANAERTHPYVIRDREWRHSEAYRGPAIPHGCDEPLPEPPARARSMRVTTNGLPELRALVASVARSAGLGADRTDDLLLVASELGSNAIRHGHGGATIHVWRGVNEVICQVQDGGHIADPLAGRRLPVPKAVGGLGLWMVNRLCDLVEARTGASGTTVRARVSLDRAAVGACAG